MRDCPVCEGHTEHRTVWRKWGYPILHCLDCGLGCTDAAGFDPETYYTADYFTGKHRDGYGDYVGSQAVLRGEFAGIARHLRNCGAAGKLLEVGSAYGYFLEAANEAGFHSTGIEICADAVAASKSRGLNAHAGVVTREFLRQHGPFDAVAMLDVIEHLPNPAPTIAMLSESLKPGGIMTITTGNWSSLLSRVMGSRWRLMTPPQHLYFYSRYSLATLLANHGLEAIHATAPWKKVPLGLMAYQITRRLGLPLKLPPWMSRIGLPVNLFDAMRLTARKEPA